jgi:hypothetical protein
VKYRALDYSAVVVAAKDEFDYVTIISLLHRMFYAQHKPCSGTQMKGRDRSRHAKTAKRFNKSWAGVPPWRSTTSVQPWCCICRVYLMHSHGFVWTWAFAASFVVAPCDIKTGSPEAFGGRRSSESGPSYCLARVLGSKPSP